MKVTIKDIAKKAGVSASTVSLVLNNRPCRVSQATRETIRAIAKQYNYKVNQTARSLVTRKSNILGLIIPDIENLFFSALCKRMEEYLRELGYALMIVNSNDHVEDDSMLIDLLVSRGVDGLGITVSNESFQDDRIRQKLSSLSIPYVMIDRQYPDLHCSKVYFDNETGAYMAIQKLVESGHKKIACIGISSTSKTGASRVAGYRKAMQQFQLEVREDYILDGNYRFQGGYACAEKLMKMDVTAAFICNDMMTLGVMRYFQEHSIRIPQDISIISYDNTLNRFTLGTEITSVDQDVALLAKTACDELLAQINEPEHPKQDICLKPQLIEKDSVQIL
ncbi:LacI family transcriptional regulator [[Clostridium] innocuum]|nr:LacI family transcriptional regulator [[Clostridium] innocuum]